MKLTPEKFKKIKKWTYLWLMLYLLFLIIFYRYTMNVNPDAFTYHPIYEENPWENVLTWAYRTIAVGFIGIGIILYRDVKQHKEKHPLMKIVRLMQSVDEKEDKDEN